MCWKTFTQILYSIYIKSQGRGYKFPGTFLIQNRIKLTLSTKKSICFSYFHLKLNSNRSKIDPNSLMSLQHV